MLGFNRCPFKRRDRGWADGSGSAGEPRPRMSAGRRKLLTRALALVLTVGLLVGMVLSDLPRILWRQSVYADSKQTDASESLDRIFSILQGSLTDPQTYEDYYQLASISIGKGEYDKALEELDKCLELVDETDTAAIADVWTKKGSLFALQGKYAQAVAGLDRALDIDPQAQQALLLRAQIHIEQRNYGTAVEDLKKYIKISPDELSPLSTLAQLYEAMGKYEEARDSYDRLYAVNPADDAQRLNSLRCTFLLQQYEAALAGLDEYLGARAEGDAQQGAAAQAETAGGAPSEESIEAAGQAQSGETADEAAGQTQSGETAGEAADQAQSGETAGEAAGQTQSDETADEAAGQAQSGETADEAADQAQSGETAGEAADQAQSGETADETADQAKGGANLPAQANYAHYLRALCHMQLTHFDPAAADLLDALALGYDQALCFEQLTACNYALERHDQVLDFGEKLLALDAATTAFDVLYQRMGVSAMTLEETEKGIEYLTKSLDLNNTLAGSHYYRGLCRLTLMYYQDAIDDFTASIEQNFLVQFCHYNRGVCYVQLMDYESALSDMEKTLISGDDQGLKDAATTVLWQLAQYYENEKQRQAVQPPVQPTQQEAG